MLEILALLLFALPLSAQTVQNPSFEISSPAGTWNYGPIPGWTIAGSAGLLAIPSFLPSTCDNSSTVAWSNGGTISQDLGTPAQANTNYALTVCIVRRSDSLGSTYTITIGTCSVTGLMSTVPAGTASPVTLPCPTGATPPAGNLSISLGCSGVQCDFDSVSLSTGPPQTIPLSMTFPGSGSGQGFTLTVNAVAVPSCNVATDGDCSLALQISAPNTSCSVDSTNTITCSGGGTLAITKTSSLPTPQIVTTIIANVKSP